MKRFGVIPFRYTSAKPDLRFFSFWLSFKQLDIFIYLELVKMLRRSRVNYQSRQSDVIVLTKASWGFFKQRMSIKQLIS